MSFLCGKNSFRKLLHATNTNCIVSSKTMLLQQKREKSLLLFIWAQCLPCYCYHVQTQGIWLTDSLFMRLLTKDSKSNVLVKTYSKAVITHLLSSAFYRHSSKLIYKEFCSTRQVAAFKYCKIIENLFLKRIFDPSNTVIWTRIEKNRHLNLDVFSKTNEPSFKEITCIWYFPLLCRTTLYTEFL